jgi:rhamnogalacturonyl hydrolase YesR
MVKLQRLFLFVFAFGCFNTSSDAQAISEVSASEITKLVFEKGLQHTELDFYAGTLMLHGVSEFALLKGNDSLQERVVGMYRKFGNGEIKAKGNFISYEAGGSGAAYLAWKGVTNVLDSQVAATAAKMMQLQKRSPEGLMTAGFTKDDQVFIDIAFAVTPYFLYSGLKLNNKEYIDFAVFETLGLFRILKDQQTGLLHQARGFKGVGTLTQDNWSRGNGWGAFALASLVRDLPRDHPKRKEVVTLAQQFFTSVLQYQNKEGMWHQEMTDPTSYVETSGSGLLLYGIGIMLEKELLDKKYMENFKLGLRGFTSYIGSDGSVSHACFSCLAPGKGTKEDYKNRAWVYNDHHAFGPVVLAFAQAAKMGIDNIIPLKKMGYYSLFDSPEVPRAYVMHARGVDVAWENDRIGFRLYGGTTVRDKVRSGIDVWAKKVEYPVLEKWYQLNAAGKDYHVDRGEGCDFYHMAKRLGCGAIAIWIDGKPYGSETWDSYRITKNQDDKIAFELQYKTWNVPGIKIEEQKEIELPMGTNFFKVTSIIKSEQNMDLTIAIGLSTFGKAEVYRDKKTGTLTVWEKMDTANGSMGTAVLGNPKNFAGFANYQGDEYILIKVKSNTPFIYYAGAGWEKNNMFPKIGAWKKYVKLEAKKAAF